MTDPGVGNERTALAWQRTALTVVGGGAVETRLVLHDLGVAAAVGALAGTCLGVWVLLESRRRYLHRHEAGPWTAPRGGATTFALALATVVGAASALAAIVASG